MSLQKVPGGESRVQAINLSCLKAMLQRDVSLGKQALLINLLLTYPVSGEKSCAGAGELGSQHLTAKYCW